MVTVISAVGAVLILLCGPISYSLNPVHGYLVKVAVQVPLLPAIAIQSSMATSLEHQERSGSRSLGSWRLTHVVVLTVIAAGFSGAASIPLAVDATAHSDQGIVSVIRNLLALTGVGLIGSAIVGPRLAWIFPVTWLIVPFLFIPRPASDPVGIFTLVGQDDAASVPFVTALVVWIIGAALASVRVRPACGGCGHDGR